MGFSKTYRLGEAALVWIGGEAAPRPGVLWESPSVFRPESSGAFLTLAPLRCRHGGRSCQLIKSRLLVIGVDREHLFKRPRAIFYVDLPFSQCWR